MTMREELDIAVRTAERCKCEQRGQMLPKLAQAMSNDLGKLF